MYFDTILSDDDEPFDNGQQYNDDNMIQKAWKPGDSKMPGYYQKLGGTGLQDTLTGTGKHDPK